MRTKEFKLGDLFNIFKGKRLTKEDMIEGKTNYIGAISENNGVREKIGQEPLFNGCCITINYNGSVGESFFQIKPFWPSDDVNVLYLKDRVLTENIALYIITIIKANKYRFSYGRKWTLDKMKISTIPLPVKDDDTIDWEYMENFISSLHNKHIVTGVEKNIDKTFNVDAWEKVAIKDIFKVKKPKNTIAGDVNPGKDINYITRTSLNNGCELKIIDEGHKKYGGNCITIGGESASIFYQDKEFVSGNNLTILYNENLNKYNALFIVTILSLEKYRYSYGRAFNKEHVENTIVKLPFKNGDVDWDYMEKYIKRFEFSDKI